MRFKRIFVTVGTTEFNALIECLCKKETIEALKSLGCSQLIIQYGNGIEYNFNDLIKEGIQVESYKLKSSILDDIKSADLVISHAGAGSCMEILQEGKALVVVINEELMGNHQIELAEQLSMEGYLYYCTTKTLPNTLIESSFNDLKSYVKGDMKEFIKHLDLLMGFS